MIEQRRFDSKLDFIKKFINIFRGPTFLMTFLRVDPRLRELVCLSVSVTNNCRD